MNVGQPPQQLLQLLAGFEGMLSRETKKGLPNIQLLKSKQEEIERYADRAGIHIDWMGSNTHVIARLSGECFGSVHLDEI
tara:strand:+ start:233 stop:472 length:240 start_codon:yes stop_codon:yes gene_type:complete